MSNAIANRLSIQHPIIQAPMLGVTTPAMAAAASNTGGLGSLPVGGLSPEKTRTLIQETKSNTSQPFAVNLFAHDLLPLTDEQAFNRMQDFLETIHNTYGLPFERKAATAMPFYHYSDQIEILLQAAVPVVSFTFGMLHTEHIQQLHTTGTAVMGTATSVQEAKALAATGVDIVVVQGIEAGGHRGSFMMDDGLPQVGLFSLLSQISDAIDLPVIAAGGIYDKKTMNAALTLGAQAVQIGTLFVPAHESAAVEVYKQAVLAATDTDTALTRAFSGRWARGIKNHFMDAMEKANIDIPYYTYQNYLTSALRSFGQQHNIKEIISMWAGQAAGKAVRQSTTGIMNRLIADWPNDR